MSLPVMGGILAALVIAALALLVSIVIEHRRHRAGQEHYEANERSVMPPEIARGTLVYSEQRLRSLRPRPLSARVDQVYCHEGVLVPVETKTRRRVRGTQYDCIELSVQAQVLRHADGQRRAVAAHGWVRIVQPRGEVTYVRVPLLDEATVAALHDRYHDVIHGRVAPRGPCDRGACRTCAYWSVCDTRKALDRARR